MIIYKFKKHFLGLEAQLIVDRVEADWIDIWPSLFVWPNYLKNEIES